jgi:hypothetical protein
MLRERFERAKTEGDLPTDADEAALARYIQTVFSGLCIEAAAGASSAELKGDRGASLGRVAEPRRLTRYGDHGFPHRPAIWASRSKARQC